MRFPEAYYAAGFFLALVVSLVALPVWRKWCLRWQLVDQPGGRKIHGAPIPLAGGLAVLSGILAPVLLGTIALSLGLAPGTAGELLGHGFAARAGQLSAILLGGLGMVLLGLWDDWKELSAPVKFSGQLAIAFLVAFSGVRVTLFVPDLFFSYAITLLWIITITNALNFMDNMNGLCAGLGFIAATIFGVTAALNGQYLVALLGFGVSGALLGFLPYNYPRAGAFLGDSGSHLVGYLLAVLAILPHFYTADKERQWVVLSPLLILAIPLLDLAWVVLIRLKNRRPFYIGDTNHISHRLVRQGLKPALTVALIWVAAALLGGVTLLF
jgi:UDP-GlcNAc:undecaprenyl-phosphate/decaprenyl-phosphate GlcNAc-1-phosphate transferase